MPSMEPLYGSEHMLPSMLDITFSVDGIQHLLSIPNVSKASGLDPISLFILKERAEEILQVIFTQSLNTGSLPSDWLTANIRPVVKI